MKTIDLTSILCFESKFSYLSDCTENKHLVLPMLSIVHEHDKDRMIPSLTLSTLRIENKLLGQAKILVKFSKFY